jgi:hypothetical protein
VVLSILVKFEVFLAVTKKCSMFSRCTVRWKSNYIVDERITSVFSVEIIAEERYEFIVDFMFRLVFCPEDGGRSR